MRIEIGNSESARSSLGRRWWSILGVLLPWLVLLGAFCDWALAQQPTSTAPIFQANAQYLQGRTWADYRATAGTGLTLNVAAGTVWCKGTLVTYTGGPLTMTNSTSNYVYLDTTSSCTPAKNTTGFTSNAIPLATVVAAGGAITSVTDQRALLAASFSSSGAALSADGFPGVDFSTKVIACLAAVAAVGGGTCDARALTGPQTITSSIIIPRHTTLLLGWTTLTSSVYPVFQLSDASRLIGSGMYKYGGGTGTTVIVTNTTNNSVITIAAGEVGYHAEVAWLSLFGMSRDNVGQIALDFRDGLVSSSVHDIEALQYEQPLILGGSGACVCYNNFTNVGLSGKTAVAHFKYSANQNTWIGGTLSGLGATGILIDNGSAGNNFFDYDLENIGTAIQIAGSANSFWGGYLEAYTTPLQFDSGAQYNYLTGASYVNSSQVVDNSGNTTNWWGFGALAGPPWQYAFSDYYLGSWTGKTKDKALAALHWTPRTQATGLNSYYRLEYLYTPYNQVQSLIRGLTGHGLFLSGGYSSTSGITTVGGISTTALADPSAPTVTVVGTPGGTTVKYAVVCRMWNGITLPSSFTQITNAPDTLNTNNYVHVAWTATDGCSNWDVLKGDTTHSIDTWNVAGSYDDQGGATSAYVPPTRNTTADLDLGGNFSQPASSYHNFGVTTGANGYGFFDDAGTMKFKNSGGAWTALSSSGGAHNLLSVTHSDSTAGTVARGDLIAGQGVSPTWTRLAKGTQYQVLTGGASDLTWGAVALNQATAVSGTLGVANGGTNQNSWTASRCVQVNAGGTALESAAAACGSGGANHALLSATHSDTTTGTVARGDIITGQGASPTWTRLAKGTAGQLLGTDGTDVTYTTPRDNLTSDGTNFDFNPLDTSVAWVREEFVAKNYDVGELAWAVSAIGGGTASVFPEGGEIPHIGMMRLYNTGAGRATVLELQSGSAGNGSSPFGLLSTTTAWDSVFIFRLNHTVDIAARIGYTRANESAILPPHWFGMRYDTSVPDTDFQFCANANGGEVCHDTGVAADTNWHKLRIRSLVSGVERITLDSGPEHTIGNGAGYDVNIALANYGFDPVFIEAANGAGTVTMHADFFAFKARGR